MKSTNPILPIFMYVCIGMCAAAPADCADNLFHKEALLEQIDSLDMEKQARKRKGLPLEDLETKSVLLKDSVATLKKNIRIEGGKTKAAAPRERPGAHQFGANRFLPSNAFDWVVFVFALIALIAGAILCVGLVSMAWKTIGMKKKPPLKTMRESLSLRDERVIRENAAPPAPGRPSSELPKGALDALKKRMHAAPEAASAPGGAPFASPTPPRTSAAGADPGDVPARPDGSPSPSPEEPRPSGTAAAIVKAASEGADVMEISKRFHVGVDQVMLILRVSHRDGSRHENGKPA
jgi:hypothetical protein